MDDKDKARARFVRKGGAGKRHKGRQSHGHSGNCNCRRANCRLCRVAQRDREAAIERQAAHLGAVVDD